MKHRQIIVAGAATSGKSTFSRELVKKFYLDHIEIDAIIDSFGKVYPKLGIAHGANTHDAHSRVCENFKPFLLQLIESLKDSEFVIEGFRMPIQGVFERYGKTHKILCFGYPNATPEQKLAECRKFDTDNWTVEQTDKELKAVFKFLIKESRHEEGLCKKLEIPFFDTSKNYLKTIQAAIESVK